MSKGKNWAQRGKIRYMSGAYDSLHGDAVVRMAEEIGANLVLVSFTGTAGDRERWKWKLVKPFVERAHESGLKVSFYMKLTNITWKPMFHERPESKDWIMRYQDGRPALYSGNPDRYMGCLNNPGWRGYLKEMIGQAVEHGADGLFYDNYFIPREARGATDEGSASGWACYCDTCEEVFKSYTKETLGWACRLPPKPDWDDPVWQAFINFRDESIVDATRMIVGHAKQLKPEIVVYPNVCPPWFGGGGAKGSTTGQIAGIVDILLFEGDSQPRLEVSGGMLRPFTAAVDWKYASALGNKPVFYRAHTPNGAYTVDHSKLGIAEAFSFGGSYQIIVAGVLAKDKEKREAVKRYYDFFSRNEQYYTGVKSVADVAILVSSPTVNWYYPDRVAGGSDLPQSIQGLAQALIELHIPFNVILDEQLEGDHGYRVLLLPNVACMSDQQAGAVAEFVERGGGLVSTNVTSLYDESYRRRQDFALAGVFGLHHGQQAGAMFKNRFGKGRSAYLTGTPEEDLWKDGLPDSLHLIEEAIAYASRGEWLIQMDAPSTTVMNVTEKAAIGATLLHLINYETTTPPQDITVRLRRPEGKSLQRVTMISPDLDGPTGLETEDNGSYISFTVPHLDIYDLVVVDWR